MALFPKYSDFSRYGNNCCQFITVFKYGTSFCWQWFKNHLLFAPGPLCSVLHCIQMYDNKFFLISYYILKLNHWKPNLFIEHFDVEWNIPLVMKNNTSTAFLLQLWRDWVNIVINGCALPVEGNEGLCQTETVEITCTFPQDNRPVASERGTAIHL